MRLTGHHAPAQRPVAVAEVQQRPDQPEQRHRGVLDAVQHWLPGVAGCGPYDVLDVPDAPHLVEVGENNRGGAGCPQALIAADQHNRPRGGAVLGGGGQPGPDRGQRDMVVVCRRFGDRVDGRLDGRCGGGGVPVALPGERVGGQRGPPVRAVEQPRPVEVAACPEVVGEHAQVPQVCGVVAGAVGAVVQALLRVGAVHRGRVGGLVAGQPPLQPVGDGGQVGGHEREAVLAGPAAQQQGQADIAGVGAGVLAQVDEQPVSAGAQLLRRQRGQRDQVAGAVGAGRGGGGGVLDDQVRVGAAETEGAERGPAASVRSGGPRLVLGGDAERAVVPGDVLVEPVEVQRARDLPVPHPEQDLEQPGDARGRGGVPDVGLDRAERAERGAFRVVAERAGERLELDRVTELGAGAVGLDELDLLRVHPGGVVHVADQPFLRSGAGGGDAVGGAVLVEPGGADDAVHVVAVGDRVAQQLEHDDADALAGHEAVGAVVEGVAVPGRREHARLLGGQVVVGGALHGHAAGQRHGDLAGAQRLGGEVDGDQRARAGGVNGDGRAAQVEVVGDPGRDHRFGVAPHGLGGQVGVRGGEVVTDLRTDVDAHGLVPDAGARTPGVLQGFPGFFQHQALLGVHEGGLDAGDGEEQGVEQVDVVEHGGSVAERLAGRVVPGQIPAGDRADDLLTGGEVLPQLRGVLGAPVAPAHADDGDGFVPRHRLGFGCCLDGGRRGGGGGDGGVGGGHVVGERVNRGVVEQVGGGQVDAQFPVEVLHQLHRQDGVYAVVAERVPGGELGAVESQCLPDPPDDQLSDVITGPGSESRSEGRSGGRSRS